MTSHLLMIAITMKPYHWMILYQPTGRLMSPPEHRKARACEALLLFIMFGNHVIQEENRLIIDRHI